jgi:hypothetical protein
MGGFATQPRLPPRARGFARAACQMAPHLRPCRWDGIRLKGGAMGCRAAGMGSNRSQAVHPSSGWSGGQFGERGCRSGASVCPCGAVWAFGLHLGGMARGRGGAPTPPCVGPCHQLGAASSSTGVSGAYQFFFLAFCPASLLASLRKTDELFFGYIVCMGLSTGMSRQKYFKCPCQKYQKYNQCNPSDLCSSRPVGAPRRPESPSDDIVVGRASFR